MSEEYLAGNEGIDEGQSGGEIQALNEILASLQPLHPDARERILRAVATFFGVGLRTISSAALPQQGTRPEVAGPAFSEDRSSSPKQFMLEKKPRTDVERVACLAFYLTHYRGNKHFKTLDISKLNTEAAQVKFSNAAVAVDNATKQHYLVAAGKGNKQLSALGEQFVLALPNRDKAKAIMANARPRRKPRRNSRRGN